MPGPDCAVASQQLENASHRVFDEKQACLLEALNSSSVDNLTATHDRESAAIRVFTNAFAVIEASKQLRHIRMGASC